MSERGQADRAAEPGGDGETSRSTVLDSADYECLRRAARRSIRRHGRDDPSIDSPGLVGEAYARVAASCGPGRGFEDHRVYVRAMRQVLIDRYRHRSARKRGGGLTRVPLDVVLDRLEAQGVDPVELGPALDRLAAAHPLAAEVLELRFFLEIGPGEIARRLRITRYRADAALGLALGWLHRELTREPA